MVESWFKTDVVPRRNRLLVCPECKKKALGADKNIHTYPSGLALRERTCGNCGAIINTKQLPEEITGIKLKDGTQIYPPPFLN